MIIKVVKEDGSGCTCNCTKNDPNCFPAYPVPCGCIDCATGEIGPCGTTPPPPPPRDPCDALIITECNTGCAREITQLVCGGQTYTKYADIYGVVSYVPDECTLFSRLDEVFLKAPDEYTKSINEAVNTYWLPEAPPIICDPGNPCDGITITPCENNCSQEETLTCADGTLFSYTVPIAGYVATIPEGCSGFRIGDPVPDYYWEPPDTSYCTDPCSLIEWVDCDLPNGCGIVATGSTGCNGVTYTWKDIVTKKVKETVPGCTSLPAGTLDETSVIREYTPTLPGCCDINWAFDDPCACLVTGPCTSCGANGATICKGLTYEWQEVWTEEVITIPAGCTGYKVGKPVAHIYDGEKIIGYRFDPTYTKTWTPEEPPCGATGPIPASCNMGCYGLDENGALQPKDCAFVCCDEKLKVPDANCLPIGENENGKKVCADYEHKYQLGWTGYYYDHSPLANGQTIIYTSDFGIEKAISAGPFFDYDFNGDGTDDQWSTDINGVINWIIFNTGSFLSENVTYFYSGTLTKGFTVIYATQAASFPAKNISPKVSEDIISNLRVQWYTDANGVISWIEGKTDSVTSIESQTYWYNGGALVAGIIMYAGEFTETPAALVEFTYQDQTYKTDAVGILSLVNHPNSITDTQNNVYWYDEPQFGNGIKLYLYQHLNTLAVNIPLVEDQDLNNDENFNEAWSTNNVGIVSIIYAHPYSFSSDNTIWWYDTQTLEDNVTVIYTNKYASAVASAVGPFYDYDFNGDNFTDKWETSSSGILSISPYHQYQLGSLNYWCDTFPVVQSETIIYNAQYSKTPAINKSNEIADCDGDIFEDRFSTNDFGVITYEKGHESQLSNYWYDGTLTQGVTIIYGTRFTTEPLKNHGPILDDYDFNDDGHKDLWGTDANGYVYWLLNRPYKFSIYWYDIGEDSEQIELGQTVLYATQYSNDHIGAVESFIYKGINYSVNASGIIDIIIPPPSEPPPE
jgi:hypothetical protein